MFYSTIIAILNSERIASTNFLKNKLISILSFTFLKNWFYLEMARLTNEHEFEAPLHVPLVFNKWP